MRSDVRLLILPLPWTHRRGERGAVQGRNLEKVDLDEPTVHVALLK